jgi:hypothetical protein
MSAVAPASTGLIVDLLGFLTGTVLRDARRHGVA